MSSYQPNIPTGTTPLSIDYVNIQNNFQQLDTSFGVDHLPFSNQTAQNGYHQSVHLNPVSTTTTNPPNNQPVTRPIATPGIGQIFSSEINDGLNTDQAFFCLSGGNRLFQLTRNISPKATPNGFGFLVGGIIMQWGIVSIPNSGSATGTVTFSTVTDNIAFPTAAFCAIVSLVSKVGGTGSSSDTIAVRSGSLTTTGFTWDWNGNAGSYVNFYYLVIGN